MTASTLIDIGRACVVLLLLGSCANTIKGMGRDTANAVNATEHAGKTVGKAVAN
jgi:predicted small secreted protein